MPYGIETSESQKDPTLSLEKIKSETPQFQISFGANMQSTTLMDRSNQSNDQNASKTITDQNDSTLKNADKSRNISTTVQDSLKSEAG